MKYYYANSQNQPVGPVELADLQRLLVERAISPSTNVIAEGATTWVPLSSLLPGVPPSPKAKVVAMNLPTDFIGLAAGVINGARWLTSPEAFARWMRFFTKAGQVLATLGAALGLVISIILGIKTNQFSLFFAGVLAILVLGFLQFVAHHFLKGCERLIANNPSRISSPAVLDCFALLLLLGAVAFLLAGIIGGVRANSFSEFLIGFVWAFLLCMGAVVALHPKIVSVSVEEATAAEEATGVISFFLKGSLAALPVLFMLTALSGVVALLFSFSDTNPLVQEYGLYAITPDFLARSLAMLGASGIGFGTLILAALLPLIAYLFFLLAYLWIDLVTAIVGVIPRKLNLLGGK